MENFKNTKILEFIIVLFFIFLGAGFRLIPHAPNFTPIAAMALFGGVYLSKKTAFILPLSAMFVSDFFLGFYEFKIMAAVYGSFLFCVALGLWLKKNKNWKYILGSSFLTASIFFFVTNFAVFAFTPWYAKTFSGFLQCYFMALPFLKNNLMGDIFYTTVFFGAYELSKVLISKKLKVQQKISPC